MLAEPEEALRAMAKKTAIIRRTVTTAATIGHCRRSQPPSRLRRRSAAARVAALRWRAARMRSRWLALSRLPPFADFADDDDAPPFAPFVPLGGDHLAAGRVAVLVVLRVPTDDPPPDGRCAPLRLFRFFAMR